jgi:DNA primase
LLLHGETARLDPSGIVSCHGLRKVEADSVAYLTAISLGIGTHAIGFPNVSAWAGTDPRANPAAAVRAVASRVLAATDTILTHLDTGLPQVSAGNTRAITTDTAHDLFGTPQLSPPLAKLARLNEIAARYFRQRLAGSWVPGYLSRRGFASGVQQRWMVGYAPAAWDELTCHLRSLGYPDPLIEASGLARRSRRGTLTDTFRDRVILPIRSTDGATLGFMGRAPAHASRGAPKYLNSPSTGLYDKSEVLFGLREAREDLAAGARPVLVEGPLDAIAVTIASPGRYADRYMRDGLDRPACRRAGACDQPVRHGPAGWLRLRPSWPPRQRPRLSLARPSPGPGHRGDLSTGPGPGPGPGRPWPRSTGEDARSQPQASGGPRRGC